MFSWQLASKVDCSLNGTIRFKVKSAAQDHQGIREVIFSGPKMLLDSNFDKKSSPFVDIGSFLEVIKLRN